MVIIAAANLLDDSVSLEGNCCITCDAHAERAALCGEVGCNVCEEAAEETGTLVCTYRVACCCHDGQDRGRAVAVDKEVAEERRVVRTAVRLAPNVQRTLV